MAGKFSLLLLQVSYQEERCVSFQSQQTTRSALAAKTTVHSTAHINNLANGVILNFNFFISFYRPITFYTYIAQLNKLFAEHCWLVVGSDVVAIGMRYAHTSTLVASCLPFRFWFGLLLAEGSLKRRKSEKLLFFFNQYTYN